MMDKSKVSKIPRLGCLFPTISITFLMLSSLRYCPLLLVSDLHSACHPGSCVYLSWEKRQLKAMQTMVSKLFLSLGQSYASARLNPHESRFSGSPTFICALKSAPAKNTNEACQFSRVRRRPLDS